MIHAQYRSEYPGEFIVLETKWSGGKKTQTREWIDNPIQNQHLSHRAACIGTSIDLERFNYTILQRHRGGLLGSKKLQTYGTGAIAKDMRLDFAVEMSPDYIEQIKELKYYENNIVYSGARMCIANPGLFYLVPHSPRLLTEVLPLYLAAFDGHKEIFMLGYTNDSPIANLEWTKQVSNLFEAYSSTKFYPVGVKNNLPQQWLEHLNVSAMTYNEFISYCDV